MALNQMIAFINKNIGTFKEKVLKILGTCLIILLGAYTAIKISFIVSSKLGYF